MHFIVTVKGFQLGHMVPKLAKITWNMTFGHFSHISTSRKLEMDSFSGSTIISYRLSETTEMVNPHKWSLHKLVLPENVSIYNFSEVEMNEMCPKVVY